MSAIGESYYKEGKNNLKNGSIIKAIASFNKASAEGHGGAMAQLGYMHEKGYGVTKNLDKAREYYENGGSTDDLSAQGMLGDFYFRGLTGENKIEHGIVLMKEAGKAGDIDTIKKLIRYIGRKRITATREELSYYIAHADKMLREGRLNEIDLIRLIYLENGEMTDAELMQFGQMFFDMCHYEDAEGIFEGIVKRNPKADGKDYDTELKNKTGYVTAGKRAEFWLHIIQNELG